ncbi:MAG TPA: cytochrome c-type biogenesis protein [Gemmatimonadaceae bacterium]|nr:cytochrome c-type biogenesis protein [Gemmatimonadaceae bacterium]
MMRRLILPTRVVAGLCLAVAAALTIPVMGAAAAQPVRAGSRVGATEAAAPRRIPNDTALERKTKEVAAQLRCPVCQGLSLQDSPSELAQEMKDVVRDQLAAGKSPAEVKAYFVSKYGQWILLEPEPQGINLAVYLLPFAVVVGGAAFIVLAVRRWTRRAGPGNGEGEMPDEMAGESDAGVADSHDAHPRGTGVA